MKPDPHQILQHYLNGEDVSESDIVALSDWIAESPEHAQHLVESAAIDLRLEEIAQESSLRQLLIEDGDVRIVQSVIDEATFRRQINEVHETRLLEQQVKIQEAAKFIANAQGPSIDRGPRVIVIPKTIAWLGLAAILCIIGTLGLLFFSPPPQSPTLAERQPAVTPDKPPAPKPVASVLRVSGADEGSGLFPGTDLVPGRYELKQGFVEVGMLRGASVLVQAPCRFELIDDNQLYLIDGQLTADVPAEARLFTVQTPSMTLVDLGTRFGARVNQDGSSTAAVFRGEVIAKQITTAFDPSDDTQSARVVSHKLITGNAIHASQQEGIDQAPHALQPDHDFLPTWRDLTGRVQITGQARFFVQPPADIGPNALIDPDHMIVFQEQTAVLDAPIRVMTELSNTTRTPTHNTQVPAGTRVISYMLHFSPAEFIPGGGGQGANVRPSSTVSATIQFPGRVLGLISGVEGMAATNESLGLDSVTYVDPNDTVYNCKIDNWPGDGFKIIGDQQNILEIHLGAVVHSDQARVLVEVPAD